MNQLLSFRVASTAAIAIFALLIGFHFVVIAGMLVFDFAPVDHLWGGRLATQEQLLMFEAISLVMSLVALILTLVKAEFIAIPRLKPIADIGMWVLAALFAVNTASNLMSESTLEKTFALVTAILVVLTLRLARERGST